MKKLPIFYLLFSTMFMCSVYAESNSIFEKLTGKWDLVSAENSCRGSKTVHVVSFSHDKRDAFIDFINIPTSSKVSYRVIYNTNSSVTMFLNGENRKIKRTGDLYIWVMEAVDVDRYAWRLYAHDLRDPEPTTSLKCN
ncbi:hypothetical protein [Zooshikella sp. RANM57]|uniref:hypothetical protein n=1 Tax=Zooshikella sp. RANM57 TaxID=3425863 RepID=UPI003D6EC862